VRPLGVLFLHSVGPGGTLMQSAPGTIRMGFLGQLTNLFSRIGRDDNRMQQAMRHAHAKRPAQAIALYDALVNSKGTSPIVRARALFNRALARSSMKDDAKAIDDLERVVMMPGAPENVLSAARNQLVRVRNRIQRVHDRADK
jgi:hypothetical protein